MRELAARGWEVTGTVRREGRTELHAIADTHDGRFQIEQLDIADDAGIQRHRRSDEPVGRVTVDVFTQVMIPRPGAPSNWLLLISSEQPAAWFVRTSSLGPDVGAAVSRPVGSTGWSY